MLINISEHFIEAGREWNIGENPDVPTEVADRWISEGKATTDTDGVRNQSPVSGALNTYIRWCITGKDTSGTLFKDVSGAGNNATIEASNAAPFATDNRIATAAHATAGGVNVSASATSCDLATDSFLMAFAMTNEDPVANEVVAAFGGAQSAFAGPGAYLSHRSAAAGVGRVVVNTGAGSLVSASDSSVKFSNAGGTRETHAVIAYDALTKSIYLYRDGVLATSNVGLLTGGSAFVSTAVTFGARLGGAANLPSATVAGVFRGWQGYVFAGKGLPVNIGRIAAILAESPSIPLSDYEFTFA